MILRAVLFVETVMAVGAMFGATDMADWLLRVSVLSGAALPATLAWLIVACSLKKLLARLAPAAQQVFGVALGAAGGPVWLRACSRWQVSPAAVPWVASAFAGALLSAALVAALVLRAKGRMPADTAARLSELQARIRPHFLFNTLNSAIALVREDPARAEAILEDLSDLFRHALVDPGESVTLGRGSGAGAALPGHRAGAFRRTAAGRVGARRRRPAARGCRRCCCSRWWKMPSSTGWSPAPRGAQVKISTQRRSSTVVIKVTNTVPAGQGRPGHGVAQDNVRDRLRLLHDVQGQFQTVLKDGIYQVRMEVPV